MCKYKTDTPFLRLGDALTMTRTKKNFNAQYSISWRYLGDEITLARRNFS